MLLTPFIVTKSVLKVSVSQSSWDHNYSLTHVYMHVSELYEAHVDVLPADFGYDDGVIYGSLLTYTKTQTAVQKNLGPSCQFIYGDRFHWKKHKVSHNYGNEHCNPNHNQSIDGANAEICEQSYRWFARHNYSVNCNHMTPGDLHSFPSYLSNNTRCPPQRDSDCQRTWKDMKP